MRNVILAVCIICFFYIILMSIYGVGHISECRTAGYERVNVDWDFTISCTKTESILLEDL